MRTMKTYTAELTSRGSHWVLHTCFTRAGQPVISEGWTRHPSVEDARAFLDDLCLRLGATIDRVVVVDGPPTGQQDDARASVPLDRSRRAALRRIRPGSLACGTKEPWEGRPPERPHHTME
jgi:hypothetical protein